MRILAFLAIVAPVVAAFAAVDPAPRAVGACSVAPPDLASIARGATLIAVVEVVAPGGPENPMPTLAPLPTFTPEATATFETPPATLKPFEKTPTPFGGAPQPVGTPHDLTGFGGRVRVVTSYVGQPSGELELDAARRAELALLARKIEALPPGLTAPCPLGLGGYSFAEVGRRHLVLASADGSVTFGPALAGTAADPYMDGEYFYFLPRTVAERYFPAADFAEDYTVSGDVFVHEDKVPVSKMIAVIAELRGDGSITPPNTGGVGLKQGTQP